MAWQASKMKILFSFAQWLSHTLTRLRRRPIHLKVTTRYHVLWRTCMKASLMPGLFWQCFPYPVRFEAKPKSTERYSQFWRWHHQGWEYRNGGSFRPERLNSKSQYQQILLWRNLTCYLPSCSPLSPSTLWMPCHALVLCSSYAFITLTSCMIWW